MTSDLTSRAGAVVTGAGRGLGKEIARLLVERGHLVLVTDVDEAAATATATELGERAVARSVDVRDHAQDDAARRLMIEVNAIGTINGTIAALDAMRGPAGAGDGGHVVNIVSLAGLTAVAGEAVYAASKHAAIGFSLSTMADLRAAGVRNIDISCVCPDGIWTPMLHDRLDDPGSALSFSGKLLQPEEVVDAIRKVLDKPRLVTAVPGWRGVVARVGDVIPSFGLAAVPLVVRQGRRVQKKMLKAQAPE
jgi:short-subunit dehydrogenase